MAAALRGRQPRGRALRQRSSCLRCHASFPRRPTRHKDAYSGFEGTELRLPAAPGRRQRVFVGGLATDYCVLNTVRDALRLGYRRVLLQDAIRAVDVQPGDGERAIAEMLQPGRHGRDLEADQGASP